MRLKLLTQLGIWY